MKANDSIDLKPLGLPESRKRWPMPILIAGVALLTRLCWLVTQRQPIDNEGADYARVADNLLSGNGYVDIRGVVRPGFPPLYSLLIAAVTPLTHNSELAGRIVSLLMGAALVVPVFLIARRIYGERPALFAALLVAFHPFLTSLSASVLTEAAYLLLVISGVYYTCEVYFGQRISGSAGWRPALGAGACFGMAYLARAEALVFALASIAALAAAGLFRKGAARAAVACLGLLLPVMLFMTPYVAFTWVHTGHLRIEGKTGGNYELGERINSGMTFTQAESGIAGLSGSKPAAASPAPTVAQLGAYALRAAKRQARTLVHLLPTPMFGSVLLLTLVVLGLFRSAWSRARLGAELYFLLLLCAAFVPLLTIQWFWERFAAPFVPFLIIWAGNGCAELYAWLADTARLLRRKPPSFNRFAAAAVLVFAALLAFAGLNNLRAAQPRAQVEKSIGLWLAQHGAAHKKVMDKGTIASYYAGATLVDLPYADSLSAIGYIRHKKPDFVLLFGGWIPDFPFVRAWMHSGLPDEAADLVYRTGQAEDEQGLVYELHWSAGIRRSRLSAPASGAKANR
jgi:4-amino-4-deoxy-L-arabinose transferase-like glycosyltransferase